MQISNSIGHSGYLERASGRAARPGLPFQVEEQAARRNPSPVPDSGAPASTAIPTSEAVPLLPPPAAPSRAQSIDETLVRGRLMGKAGGSLSNRLAIAQYADVSAQPERSHIAAVLGVDAYA